MNEGGYNKFSLSPNEDSDSLSVYLQVGYSDVYVRNYNSQLVGVRLIEFKKDQPEEIGLNILKPNAEAVFLGSPNFNKEYQVTIRYYKNPDSLLTALKPDSAFTYNEKIKEVWDGEVINEKTFKFVVCRK
jgi:hypothetical protein